MLWRNYKSLTRFGSTKHCRPQNLNGKETKHLSNRMRKNDIDVSIVFGDKLFHISNMYCFWHVIGWDRDSPTRFNISPKKWITTNHWYSLVSLQKFCCCFWPLKNKINKVRISVYAEHSRSLDMIIFSEGIGQWHLTSVQIL